MTNDIDGVRAELERQIQFEGFVADCAARFAAALPPSLLEREIESGMRALVSIVHADRCALFGGASRERVSWITGTTGAEGLDRLPPDTNFAAMFPWHFERLFGHGEPVVVAKLADLPPDAEADRRAGVATGIGSMLTVPVLSVEGGAHCLMIQSRRERHWPVYYAARLQVLAAVFVHALSRKRAEETRGQLESRHADLLESVRAILWRADPRTFQTRFVSKEAETILGYPLESWTQVPGFWRDHIHPDDRQWVEALSRKAVQDHRKHDFEYRMVDAEGRTLWLRNIVNVLVDDGQPTEIVGVTVDITERKRVEFEAAQLRHQLLHAGRVTSLGELAATLAHELNQPLGAIVSNAETAQVLLNHVPPSLDQLGTILGDIAEDGQRAGAVLHRVRTLLKKQVPDVHPLDVRRLVDSVVGLARALALSRQIELTADVPPGLPTPRGDAVEVQQVLLNLIVNAMEAVATQPAAVRLVNVRAARHGATGVELSVADTGGGIPAETLPRVFDPFFSTKPSGMGMGLTICRTIIRSHGGDILVENNADGGTTVRFTLPGSRPPDEGA